MWQCKSSHSVHPYSQFLYCCWSSFYVASQNEIVLSSPSALPYHAHVTEFRLEVITLFFNFHAKHSIIKHSKLSHFQEFRSSKWDCCMIGIWHPATWLSNLRNAGNAKKSRWQVLYLKKILLQYVDKENDISRIN